jgi:hypothetical protein
MPNRTNNDDNSILFNRVKSQYKSLYIGSNESLEHSSSGFELTNTISSFILSLSPYGTTTNCPARSIESADRFKWSYLQESIVSKLPDLTLYSEEQRADAAILKLYESEKNCKRINDTGYGKSTPSWFFNSILARSQQIIANVLGPCNPSMMFEHCRFTGGATTSRKRKQGDAYYKYHPGWAIEVTKPCERYLHAVMAATPLWSSMDSPVKVTLGNKVTTVPKKTEIDRAIACEPDGNALLQNAIGTYLKSRLLHVVNVNLRDQSTNQDFAKLGSLSGIVSTLDLAAASDSISDRLVWDLLPPDWYNLLDDLRSRYGIMPNGEVHRWEKFSAMGNGFTFELESLLFYAISRAVAEANDCSPEFVNIYGDDIIVPTRCARNLVTVLSDLGFDTNTDKSFITGLPFRESCGKHYFKGIDVTPFYIRKQVSHLPRFVWLLNALRHWSYNETLDMCCPSIENGWFALRRLLIPKCLLGGTQIHSISSVYSPCEPRKKLVFEVVNRHSLKGLRALLRYFQNNQIINNLDSFQQQNLRLTSNFCVERDYSNRTAEYSRASVRSITDKSAKDRPPELIETNEVVACLKPNNTLPDFYSSSRDFRFPTELQ